MAKTPSNDETRRAEAEAEVDNHTTEPLLPTRRQRLAPSLRVPFEVVNRVRRQAVGRVWSVDMLRWPEVPYGPFPEQRMRIWELDDLAPRDGWPAVLLLHGGGWTGGSPEEFTAFAPKLARNGWYVSAVRYRLAESHSISDALEDVLAAIDFIHHQQVDRRKVALWGYSAGAHLALLAAQRVPDQIAAVVCVAPATDPAQLPEFENLFAPEEREVLSPMAAEPLQAPPILLVHGTADEVVPFQQSRDFAERNPAAELLPVPNGDHGLRWPPLRANDARRRAVQWLRAQLGDVKRGSKWKIRKKKSR